MRINLFFICLLLAAAQICCTGNDKRQQAIAQDRPNVLLIAIDDLNDWLGCLGNLQAKTPNIDRLAKRGTLFTNAHCQAPLCGPSRASMMSGLRPSTTGIYGQINDGDLRKAHPLLENLQFLPEYFGQHGYKTMGVGKLFHHHAPAGVFQESGGREKGFGPKPPHRLKWDRKGTSTDWGAFPERDEMMPDYRTAQWAIERLEQSHDDPFFLALGFLRPHVPWHVPQQWFDLYPLDSIQTPPYLPTDFGDIPAIARRVADVPMMPTTEWAIAQNEWKSIVQAYLASISFVDHYVGQVLDALDASPYADHTIIVLWSDHGYHLGEKNRFAKHSLWERATKVPLMIAGPQLPTNRQTSAPVELLDLYPTLVDLCQLPPNQLNEGRSLKPLLKDPTTEWPYAAITTYGWNNHSVRSRHHSLIQYEDGSTELYLRDKDPYEYVNVAKDQSMHSIFQDLKRYLPQQNAKWSYHSQYDNFPYFQQQRATQLEGASVNP